MRPSRRWRVIVTAFAIWALLFSPAGAEESPYAPLFEAVWSGIFENYLGLSIVDWEAVRREYEPRVLEAGSEEEAYRLVQEMVALLGDPETFVRSPGEIAQMRAEDPAKIIGVGMLLGMTGEGDVVVLRVLARGPAERAGIRPGDRIAAVDGLQTRGMHHSAVAAMIRGEAGSVVAITVANPEGEERTISVRRAPVEFTYEVSSRNLGGGVGYLSIPTFRSGTEAQVLSHLRRLYRTQVLLLDLRGFDGLVDPESLLKIAGLFTGEALGGLLTLDGVYGIFPDREWAGGTGVFGVPPPTRLDYYEKPVVLIVDSTVAGSVLTLALVEGLRETGRAEVVGRGSPPGVPAGAGQSYLGLPGGGILSVTSSFLISHRRQEFLFQLTPDREVPMDVAYLRALYDGADPDVEAARERALALLSERRE